MILVLGLPDRCGSCGRQAPGLGSAVVIVRCTAKVLKLLRERPAIEVAPGDDDWYLNLLWIDGRKCLLLVHAATLFPIFAADVRASRLRPVGQWVAARVHEALEAERLPANTLGRLDPAACVITKTASRRVLGVMNDMAVHIEFATFDAGGLASLEADDLNRSLRRGLHSHGRDYATPFELAMERVHGDRDTARRLARHPHIDSHLHDVPNGGGD